MRSCNKENENKFKPIRHVQVPKLESKLSSFNGQLREVHNKLSQLI